MGTVVKVERKWPKHNFHGHGEKVAEALADFFWGHRNADCVPDNAIKARLRELGAKRDELTCRQVGQYISDARFVVEQKHPGHTLIRLRRLGYKLSNSTEYAEFTMGWARRTFNAAARTMELAPNMKKECIGPALKRVFGDNEADIKRLAKAKVEFGQEVGTWRKEIHNGKTGTDK